MKSTLAAAGIVLLAACSRPAAPPPPSPSAGPVVNAPPSREDLKKKLTPEQYNVCVMKGTERPFTNKYHDYKGDGLYACVACGADLFDSKTKYDSGSGWPAFWETASKERVKTAVDHHLGYPRTEVLCAKCDSHLGHVFDDGPPPTGRRYCINSAALEFKERPAPAKK